MIQSRLLRSALYGFFSARLFFFTWPSRGSRKFGDQFELRAGNSTEKCLRVCPSSGGGERATNEPASRRVDDEEKFAGQVVAVGRSAADSTDQRPAERAANANTKSSRVRNCSGAHKLTIALATLFH